MFLRRYLLNFVLRLCFSPVFVYVSSTYVASFCFLGLCGYASEFLLLLFAEIVAAGEYLVPRRS